MNGMKVTGKAGKAILDLITPLKVGQSTQFVGFMAKLGTPVDAHLTEVEDGKFWQFALYWNSVHLQDVVIERQGDSLVMDNLGT